MTYRLQIAGTRPSFGPFDTASDALRHGAMYCQDYRYEAIEIPEETTISTPAPLDAYGHLNWTVGNEDWIACFDARRVADGIGYSRCGRL